MKILVIEDNPVSAKLVESVLARAGYGTTWAPSGERALRTLETEPDIDLVVCDMGLPGLSGLEFVAEMRKLPAFTATPVIVCTATADPRVVEAAIRAGCVGYLLKPVKPGELLMRVRSAIGLPPEPEPVVAEPDDPGADEIADPDADASDASPSDIDAELTDAVPADGPANA